MNLLERIKRAHGRIKEAHRDGKFEIYLVQRNKNRIINFAYAPFKRYNNAQNGINPEKTQQEIETARKLGRITKTQAYIRGFYNSFKEGPHNDSIVRGFTYLNDMHEDLD